MAGHAQLKFVMTECSKTQIRLTRPKLVFLLFRIICTFCFLNTIPYNTFNVKWAPSSEFVSSSIPSWQISTAHVQPFRGARDLAFCLKVPLDSLLVWASSEGSGETTRMRRLAWTFAARIGDKYQIRLTRSKLSAIFFFFFFLHWKHVYHNRQLICNDNIIEIWEYMWDKRELAIEPCHDKTCLCIRAVWSAPLLFAAYRGATPLCTWCAPQVH